MSSVLENCFFIFKNIKWFSKTIPKQDHKIFTGVSPQPLFSNDSILG